MSETFGVVLEQQTELKYGAIIFKTSFLIES